MNTLRNIEPVNLGKGAESGLRCSLSIGPAARDEHGTGCLAHQRIRHGTKNQPTRTIAAMRADDQEIGPLGFSRFADRGRGSTRPHEKLGGDAGGASALHKCDEQTLSLGPCLIEPLVPPGAEEIGRASCRERV